MVYSVRLSRGYIEDTRGKYAVITIEERSMRSEKGLSPIEFICQIEKKAVRKDSKMCNIKLREDESFIIEMAFEGGDLIEENYIPVRDNVLTHQQVQKIWEEVRKITA